MFVKLTTPDGEDLYVNRNLVSAIGTDHDFYNYDDHDNDDYLYDGGVLRTSVIVGTEAFFVKETVEEVVEKLTNPYSG